MQNLGYANAVIWAEQNEIVKGISETEFAPDMNITREQIAAIMFRYSDDESQKCDRGLKQDLDSTFNQTLQDIKNIAYTPYVPDEESDEYDAEM